MAMDLVNNGGVLFSHIGADGDPVFTSNSADTPNPIGSGAVDITNLIEDYESVREEQIDRFPLLVIKEHRKLLQLPQRRNP